MSVAISVTERADHIADLIEKRLGVRGRGLESKLRRAGRELPRHVRRDIHKILEAQRLAANPKLMRQVDLSGIEAACRDCERWLETVDPSRRRKDAILGFLGVNAFNLLAISAAFLTYLVWTGRL
jgi:hypothetical protein